MRVIFRARRHGRPRHAFVDQAVVKLMRGPTSKQECGVRVRGAAARKLLIGELFRFEGLGKKPAEETHLVRGQRR